MSQATTSIKALLQRIKDGEETFTPENDTLEALEDFQFVVKTLNIACSEQLIESVFVQPYSKDRGTYGMVKAAIISGGLTVKGMEYLSTEQPGRFCSWLTTQVVVAIGGVVVTVLGIIILGLLGI